MNQAQCRCGCVTFYIKEKLIQCVNCNTIYHFNFMDDAKTLCETKADDIVILVNEGY